MVKSTFFLATDFVADLNSQVDRCITLAYFWHRDAPWSEGKD